MMLVDVPAAIHQQDIDRARCTIMFISSFVVVKDGSLTLDGWIREKAHKYKCYGKHDEDKTDMAFIDPSPVLLFSL